MTRLLLAVAAVMAAGACSPATRSGAMAPGFAKAAASFGDYAKPLLHAKRVRVSPDDEASADQLEGNGELGKIHVKVGRAWGFEANPEGKWDTAVRGWALPDGTVIAHHSNLGQLFVEAGAWRGQPTADAQRLADLFVWSFGVDHKLLFSFGADEKRPALALAPDGNGALKFLASYRQPGPGGAGGGPQYVYEYTVTLTPDHTAQIARSTNLNGGQDPPAGLLPW